MERVLIKEKKTGKTFRVAPVVAREWLSSGLGEIVSADAPVDAEKKKAPPVQKVPGAAKADNAAKPAKPVQKKLDD